MKDAKGHGSNARGGAMARLAAARNDPNHPLGALSRVVSQGTPIAGIPADSVLAKQIAFTEAAGSDMTPKQRDWLAKVKQGQDSAAASALSQGAPPSKAGPAPVHPGASGRQDMFGRTDEDLARDYGGPVRHFQKR